MNAAKLPGFVDLQVNGFLGVSYSSTELTEAELLRSWRALLSAGTGAFCPTVVTAPVEVYRHVLPLIARCAALPEFAGAILGIHCEGPFISACDGARGVHRAEHIKAPADSMALWEEMWSLSAGKLKLLTIAAEVPGAAELCAAAVARDVVVSLGHQLATTVDLWKLAEAGATMLTHLGNGCPAMMHRHNNMIWPGLAEDRLSAMIITDGHHLPSNVIKTVLRAKGLERSIVVSDMAPPAGCAPGVYQCFGIDVELQESGFLGEPGTPYLAGSGSTMLINLIRCMNHLHSLKLPGIGLEQLLQVGRTNPLRALGIDEDEEDEEDEGFVVHDARLSFDAAEGFTLRELGAEEAAAGPEPKRTRAVAE